MNVAPVGYFTLGATYPRTMLRERYPHATRRATIVALVPVKLIHISSFGVTLTQHSAGVTLSQRSLGVTLTERSFGITGGQ